MYNYLLNSVGTLYVAGSMKHDPQLVKRWFSYDPETGLITRKLKGTAKAFDILNPTRTRIDLLGVRYQVTHVIWVLHFGRWPTAEIDHINHNRHDNRIANLREATKAQNTINRRWFNPNGKGVTFRTDRNSRPWQAQIAFNGKKIHLGFFDTPEEAHEAYKKASAKYHGEFACLT